MEKDLTISYLNDVYGALLTERQVEILDLYYTGDCSLGEIAEMLGISRQSVKDSIKASEKALRNFEDKLKIYEKNKALLESIEGIKECVIKGDNDSALDGLNKIAAIIEE